MTVTWEDLQEFLGEGSGAEDVIERCFDIAVALVTKHIGSEEVPDVITDEAILLVGQAEYIKRSAGTGQPTDNFANSDGIGVTPVRLSRNPMKAAYELLRPWVLPWPRVTDDE